MYKFTKSVFINRSRKDVFDFVSDPAKDPEWQANVLNAAWTSADDPGIGSTYKIVVKLPGGELEYLFEITQWDPPNRYGYKSIKLPFPIKSIESLYSLSSEENGTQVTFDAQIGTVGLLKFAEGMIGKQAEKQDGGSIDTLKQLLEAGSV